MTEVRAYLTTINALDSLATPLDESSGWSWRTEVNEAGYGTIIVDHDDPTITSIDLPNSVVHFFLDDILAGSVVLERYNAVDYDRDEERTEQTRFEGRGPAALLDRIVIDPTDGPDRLPIQEDRVFDYRTKEYDDSAWDAATEICTVGDAQSEWPAGTTVGLTLWDADFPDPTASVLWTSEGTTALANVQDVYARQLIANGYTGKAQLLVLGDNLGEAYWNGALIVTPGQAEDSNYSGWTRASTYVLDLNPGDAILAIKWTNLGGPAGFAWALYEQDSDGVLGTLIAHSDTSATIITATEPPGMSFGYAWEILANEQTGRALGVLDPANWIDYSFGPVNDSNDNPWDLINLSTKVGTTDLTFLREASANAIDFKVVVDLDTGYVRLDAYRKGEMGDTPGVSYHLPTDTDDANTGNLISVRRTGESPAGNAFLGRWGGGWTRRLNQSSIDTYGRWEATLAVGAINDLPEARRVFDGELAEFAHPRVQTDIEIDPVDDSEVPWLGYAPEGATVDLLGEAHRILATTCSVDDATGEAHFALMLNDSVVLTFQEKLAQLTEKMVPFTLRGKSKVATQPIPRSVPRGIGAPPAPPCLPESFTQGDSLTIGPDLTWTKETTGAQGTAGTVGNAYSINGTGAGSIDGKPTVGTSHIRADDTATAATEFMSVEAVVSGLPPLPAGGNIKTRYMVGLWLSDPADTTFNGVWFEVEKYEDQTPGNESTQINLRPWASNTPGSPIAQTTGSPHYTTEYISIGSVGIPLAEGDVLKIAYGTDGFFRCYINGALMLEATGNGTDTPTTYAVLDAALAAGNFGYSAGLSLHCETGPSGQYGFDPGAVAFNSFEACPL